MAKLNTIFIAFLIILFISSSIYFSIECGKLEQKLEIKDSKLMDLQTKNADYSRIHKWIPVLEQLLTPLAKLELDALTEKLIQEKARKG